MDGWYCPHCNAYHAPFVVTCPNPQKKVTCPNPQKKKKVTSEGSKRTWTCPECGLPEGECDPDGVGHYRG